ncbi:MAG: 16S rRNA (uracil(1498)-N(3))-methyltransferase [Tidjanibacter sp.]|nr:16S rRNA (uracil(1498)-N(3))-methyltransferase [Tidjanibacter sp.]
MQLFYAPDIVPPLYTLSEQESAHCVKVLRLARGESLHLTDGRGTLYLCVVEEAHPKHCVVRVVDAVDHFERRDYSITMAVAPTKNSDRFEWFVDKAVETGVDRIIPLTSEHSERRVLNTERCRKVAVSAVKQSLKAYFPQIDEPTAFAKVVAMPFEGRRLIAHCIDSDKKIFLGDTLRKNQDALILIGPEGDFSADEVALAREAGFEEISLGASRFRTETAALAAVMFAFQINSREKEG